MLIQSLYESKEQRKTKQDEDSTIGTLRGHYEDRYMTIQNEDRNEKDELP